MGNYKGGLIASTLHHKETIETATGIRICRTECAKGTILLCGFGGSVRVVNVCVLWDGYI